MRNAIPPAGGGRLAEWPGPGAYAANAAALCAVGVVLTGAGALIAASWLPGSPWLGFAQFVGFLVAAWAIALWAMSLLYRLSDPGSRRGRNFRLPGRTVSRGALSRRADLLAGVGVVAGLFVATSLVTALRFGVPHRDAMTGQYYVVRNGMHTVVSAARRRERLVQIDRGFLGVAFAMVSFFTPVVVNRQLVLRSERRRARQSAERPVIELE